MGLTNAQHELTNQYFNLLNTIEEAFEYVIASFSDYGKTEGDRILADLFAALVQVAESHETLQEIFKEEKQLISVLNRFNGVLQQATKLNGQLKDPNQIEKVIIESLYPAFTTWREMVQRELQPHIIN
jgi:hypothetical protein